MEANLKRYDMVGEYDATIAEIEDGDYVKFEDARDRIEELEADVKYWIERCAGLEYKEST